MRENLFAYTETEPNAYPAFASLNKEEDGSISLTVRTRAQGGREIATVVLPQEALLSLIEGAAKHPGVLESITSRFLAYNFPQDMHPDGGLSYSPQNSPPCGTNLLNFQQASAMFRVLFNLDK